MVPNDSTSQGFNAINRTARRRTGSSGTPCNRPIRHGTARESALVVIPVVILLAVALIKSQQWYWYRK